MKQNRVLALLLTPFFLLSALALSGFSRAPDPEELPTPIELDEGVEMTETDFSLALYEDFTEEQLLERKGGALRIVRDPLTGRPKEIAGSFTTRVIVGEQDALMALLSVRSLMGVSDYQFACTEADDERNDFCVFTLQQLYQGVPVEMGIFRVVADKKGVPVSVSGTYQPGIQIDTEPELTAEEGRRLLDLPFGSKVLSVRLAVYTDDDWKYHLVWRYSIASQAFFGDLEDRVAYLDAATGELLEDAVTVLN